MASEEWRPVVGFEGFYLVSSEGRVRGVFRKGCDARVKKLCAGSSGYLQTGLTVDSRKTTRMVHVMVAEAFLGGRPEGNQVRHLDGNKLNNRVSNLSYGTVRQNMLDKTAHGTDHNRNKTHCPRGHLLAEPNLVRSYVTRGHRKCRSCNQAYSEMQRHGGSLQDVSDRRYSSIMAGGPPDPKLKEVA